MGCGTRTHTNVKVQIVRHGMRELPQPAVNAMHIQEVAGVLEGACSRPVTHALPESMLISIHVNS